MRRGSGSQEAQRPGEFGDGKRIPNPGGGLLNKRRERQSCAINFVCALSFSTSISLSSLDLYLQLGPSRSRKQVLGLLKTRVARTVHGTGLLDFWSSGV